MTLPIVCPTHNRPKLITTHKHIPIDALIVPKSQQKAYENEKLGVKIVTHPDKIEGIGLKRQWIYDKYGDVFQVDDDITAFMRCYLPKYRSRMKYARMTPEEARGAVDSLYQTAINLGAYLFAFAISADVRNYTAHKANKAASPKRAAKSAASTTVPLKVHKEALAKIEQLEQQLAAAEPGAVEELPPSEEEYTVKHHLRCPCCWTGYGGSAARRNWQRQSDQRSAGSRRARDVLAVRRRDGVHREDRGRVQGRGRRADSEIRA